MPALHLVHRPRHAKASPMNIITYLLQPLLVFGPLLAALLWGSGTPAERLQAGLFAGIWAHIIVSLYIGRFDRLRTRTYLALTITLLASQILGFLGFVLPWGQLSFWLAAKLPSALANLHLPALVASPLAWPALLLALLTLDVMVMQRHARRLSRLLSLGAAALVAYIAARGTYAAGVTAALQQFDSVPPWSQRPGLSLLRAVPDKTLGLALLGFASAAPLIVPWINGERFRLSRFGWLWLANGLALAATCLALGWLGGQPPGERIIFLSRIAAAAFMLFLVVIPVMMQRFVTGMSRHMP